MSGATHQIARAWQWSRGALEVGLHRPLHVREERLETRTDACRLLYVSDLRLRGGRAERLTRQVLDAVTKSRPDAVLLGGDLVDGFRAPRGLPQLIGPLCDVPSVFGVGGKHDEPIGLGRVRRAVEESGGHWIH